MQQSLFEDSNAPKQIKVIPGFITKNEEADLVRRFSTIEWQSVRMHGVVAKRKVAHYGLDYTYTKRSVQETDPAPKWLDEVIDRAAKIMGKTKSDIKEILITYYPAGAGIGWHRDAEVFGDEIVGVSFLSDCTMKFKDPKSTKVFKLEIPRRSAYAFSGEARYRWLHSIANHTEDRYSITFRTLAR